MHPQHDRGRRRAARICEITKLFRLAVSLREVETLIEAPVLTAHRSAPGSTLVPPDDLVRLAVGIEQSTIEGVLSPGSGETDSGA